MQSKALLDILAGANETGVHVLVGLYLGENDGGKRFEQEFEVLKEGVEAWGFEHVIGITVCSLLSCSLYRLTVSLGC